MLSIKAWQIHRSSEEGVQLADDGGKSVYLVGPFSILTYFVHTDLKAGPKTILQEVLPLYTLLLFTESIEHLNIENIYNVW